MPLVGLHVPWPILFFFLEIFPCTDSEDIIINIPVISAHVEVWPELLLHMLVSYVTLWGKK